MSSPPRWAERFILWFLRPELAEEVLGDLEEQYFELLEEKGKRRANLIYIWQVLNYLRPFAWKRSFRLNPTLIAMLRHTFILTFRHALKARRFRQARNQIDALLRAKRLVGGNQFKGSGLKTITHQYRRRLIERLVQRGLPATHVIVVHCWKVVVNQ